MFDNLIELIKNSVTTVVGFTMGALGVNNGELFQPQDLTLTSGDVEIAQDLSEDNGFFGTQVASISESLQSILPSMEVEEESGDSFAVATPIVAPEGETDYFDREDVKSAVFIRPITVVEETASTTTVLSQVEDLQRSINPIKSTKKVKEVDVSLILSIDFDKFNTNLQITDITDDDDSYYSKYQFNSLAIRDKVWQEVTKEKSISVTKARLDERDLGDYLSEELGEVVDNEIIFLKEVQKIQIAKKAKADALAVEIKNKLTEYETLVGKVLDVENEEFGDYVPVKKSKVTTVEENVDNITDSGVVDNEAPLLVIQGNNPALIQIGATYSDMGAKVTDNLSNNLGIVISGDEVDTSIKGSYFVTYTVTDEAGNVATATREVIVYDYGITPVVEEIVPEPVVEEVVPEPVVEEVLPDEEEIVIIEEEVIVEEEVATTTEEIIIDGEEEVATTTEEAAEPEVEEVTVSVVDVAVEAVSTVVEGGKKAGKKVKDVANVAVEATTAVSETIVEVTTVVSEAVVETTTATVEQVSEAVETITEEVSAMIKAVHFMELLGNISSALQASISTISSSLGANISNAGEGLNNTMESTGSLLKDMMVNIGEGITKGLNKTGNEITKGFKKTSNVFILISSALRANILDTSEVLNNTMESTGSLLKDVTVNIGEQVTKGFKKMSDVTIKGLKKTGDVIIRTSSILRVEAIKGMKKTGNVVVQISSVLRANILDASEGLESIGKNVGNSILEISDEMVTNVVGFRDSGKADTDLTESFNEDPIYESESFISFVLRQAKEVPAKLIKRVIGTSEGMTASVIDYNRSDDSNLEIVNEE